MISTHTLSNNIKVVLEKNPHVRTVSLGIWIKNGSIDESPENNGVSHFLEHMMFKGTDRRTTKDIADEMSKVGGRINAFTGKEYMCYYAHVIDEHFDVALDVLSDMICHSKLDPEDIEKEKKVIIEELNMYEDSPEDVVNDGLQSAVWHGHPIGYNIIGTKENIMGFSDVDIKGYFDKHYVGERMVISIVGAIDDDDLIIEKLEKQFESIDKGEYVERDVNVPYHKSFESFNKDIEQAHICMAFPTIPYDSKEKYKLSILNNIIGGGINSVLFQNIREKKGMAYSVYSFNETYKHGGLFVIYAATNPANIESVTKAIIEELDIKFDTGFNDIELDSTKEQIKSNMIIGLESMNARMSNYGKSTLIYNRIKSQDEIIDNINAVTVEDLDDFYRNLIDYNQMSIAITGPLEEMNVEGIRKLWKNLS